MDVYIVQPLKNNIFVLFCAGISVVKMDSGVISCASSNYVRVKSKEKEKGFY